MSSCDCDSPDVRKTREYTVCNNCGIVIDKLYENNLPIQNVSHFSNVLIGDVHPTINRTLSSLSSIIDMTFETRMDIIDRAYQLVNSSVNYAVATEFAFSEIFPEIDLGLTPKIIKKIERNMDQPKKNNNKNPRFNESDELNNHLSKQIKKIEILMKNGKRRGLTKLDVLKRARFSRRVYYKYKDRPPRHVKQLVYTSSTITPEIGYYILNNSEKPAVELQQNIGQEFKEKGGSKRKSVSLQSIWRFRRTMKNWGVTEKTVLKYVK